MKAACRLLAGLLALVACSACSPGRLIESARLGLDAASGAHGATEASDGGGLWMLAGQPGDLYLSGEAPLAALLMVPGVTPEGRDDPRLIAFAGSLARHRFLVFVPELPGLREQRVGRDDPAAITRAVDALATCFAAGAAAPGRRPRSPTPLARRCLRPWTSEAATGSALVVGIGGYHDVVSAITYLTTGYYRPRPAPVGIPARRSRSPAGCSSWPARRQSRIRTTATC